MKKLLLFLLVFAACTLPTPYQKMLDEELASGVRNDDLIFGLFFGMDQDSFYDHAWDLNRREIVKEGPNNTSVEYKLEGELGEPAKLNFYPEFHERKINGLIMQYNYMAWSPWNRHLWSDSLLPEVIHHVDSLFPGRDFLKVTNDTGREVLVKVDGNRRILVATEGDANVKVLISDMTSEKISKMK